jgi:hypothetical protein
LSSAAVGSAGADFLTSAFGAWATAGLGVSFTTIGALTLFYATFVGATSEVCSTGALTSS